MRNIGIVILFVTVALIIAAPYVSASTIHQASAKGDLLLVKTLVKNTPSLVSDRDESDVTPLHFACLYGRLLVVRFLLSAGAPIDAVTKNGNTPLLWAAWRKHTPVVKILLSKGANVNAKSRVGMTPLHFAVQNGDKGMAELLLNNGADISAKDNLGQTAADLARNSKTAALIALFKEVSDPNIDETKPTEIAEALPNISVPVVESTSKVNVKTTVSKSAAVPQPTIKPKQVVPKRAEVTIVPKRITTKTVKTVSHRSKPEPRVVLTRSIILAVLAAAKDEKSASLKFILDRKPGLHSAIDRNGATLMHWLAEADWAEGIGMFAEAGGNINAQKTNGVTPLQVAAALGKIKALDTLIGLGAKPNLEDSKGRTALSIARERGQEEASDILMNKP